MAAPTNNSHQLGCASHYVNDVGDATDHELIAMNYICQYIPTENNDIWLLSEEEKPIAQLSSQHPLANHLIYLPSDFSAEYHFNRDDFTRLLEQVRGDEELQTKALAWWKTLTE